MGLFDEVGNTINDTIGSLSPTTTNVLIAYGVGAGACTLVYGYRYGVKALRQFFIDKKENPNRVEAGTSLDAVLYGSLKGVGKGIVPSVFWPVLLSSYGIVKWNEENIKLQVDKEFQNKRRD